MAYVAPSTKTSGQGLSSTDWNTIVGDILYLAGVRAAQVLTSQNTTSTGFVDLSTVGPAVTVETGASALVLLQGWMSASGSGVSTVMGVAVSGASSVAASDDQALAYTFDGSGPVFAATAVALFTSLTPGNNTFTAKYRVSAGTGTFQRRRIVVVPLTA